MLPARNERDFEEVPAEVKHELEIHFVHKLDEVLPLVLAPPDADAQRSVPPPASGGEARP